MAANRAARLYANAHSHPAYRYARARAHTRCARDNAARANYCARCAHTRAYRRRHIRLRAARYIHAPAYRRSHAISS